MLECVLNLSEGRRPSLVERLAGRAGDTLLDIHTDADHHRAVLTLASHEGAEVEAAARAVTGAAVAELDLAGHAGAHPRLGVVDVVPFVPLGQATMAEAEAARDRFAAWAGAELGLPCFLYGPGRSLPDIRRRAFAGLAPDTGPARPHATAGAASVGARGPLVAYNLWLQGADLASARAVAAGIRGPHLRCLAFDLSGRPQVSCNLIHPSALGPAQAYDLVAARARVARAELVGLVPADVLRAVPKRRWPELDLTEDRSVEARLSARLAARSSGGGGHRS
ncbi:MAG: glutamate formimidoyltransferase [Acidimicrobiales bacterium]